MGSNVVIAVCNKLEWVRSEKVVKPIIAKGNKNVQLCWQRTEPN